MIGAWDEGSVHRRGRLRRCLALPVYLVGCLGLRVIGVPAILSAIFRPDRKVRFAICSGPFRGDRAVITLTCRIVPVDLKTLINNVDGFSSKANTLRGSSRLKPFK